MANPIFTGARAILKLNGQKIAVCTGVTVNESIEYDTVRTIDLMEVYEFCEAQYNASISCNVVKQIGSSPTQLGIFPHVDLLSLLTQQEMVMEIYDNVSGNLVCVGEGCKPSNNNFTVAAGAVVGNDLTFVCKRIKDVSEANN